MKKFILSALILTAALAGASAQEALIAQVMEVAGKVEYSLTGSQWRPAKPGDIFQKGTLVSTGFKSTATLKVGTSVITVKPVTRLSLEELVKTRGGTQTQLFLSAGRVQVEVVPTQDQKTEFSVRSPAATASVRGTGFEFDGYNILVSHGVVQMGTPWGQNRYVTAGEYSYLELDGSVSPPIAANTETGLIRLDELIEQTLTEARLETAPVTVEEAAPREPTVVLPVTLD